MTIDYACKLKWSMHYRHIDDNFISITHFYLTANSNKKTTLMRYFRKRIYFGQLYSDGVFNGNRALLDSPHFGLGPVKGFKMSR